ncbi:uncharacterized protein LOC115882791 [Sitophilus oryzae]|uniref:Uncharacterized protein LOC115882791 n=1 Tax=Sitophilus oryzae TaxID=7048 RepID=A0A6J2Y1V7_SITOR|nr:uncharacterized protein LOC115882791 [Sitophilus oryzae]XP_030756900.1 uncharacterized protein LOC115882791 [Sitophilus oryzae]
MSATRQLRTFHSFEEDNIQGTVTVVDLSLVYFEVDEIYRVYPDITKDYPELPLVGSVVEIKNPKIFCHSTDTAVVGPCTECCFPSVVSSETINMDLFNFLKMRRCDENEVIAMDKILRKLQKYLPRINYTRVLKIILNVAPFKIRSLPIVDNADRQSFESVKVEFPSQLGYVKETSLQYKEFMNFIGGCYHGVHPNASIEKVNNIVTEYLLGWLETDSMYGWFILRDDKYKIPVKFYKNLVPTNYLGKCILIKKWTGFTEIFESNTRTVQYLLVNIRNVVIVDSPNCKIEKLFFTATEQCTRKKDIIVFELIGKSEIIYGYSGRSECFLEVKVLEYTDRQLNSNPFIFLALTAKHFAVVPYLRENAKYRMWYSGKLEVLHVPGHKELYKLRTAKHLYRACDDAIFQAVSNQNVADSSKYEDSHQIQSLLSAQANKFVSFALLVARKYFQTCNFPSYIPKRHEDIPFFDIPGQNKQMVVEFSDASSTTAFRLYFTDRDNYVFPIGLIKDMRVLVKYVEIYKNNYFKTTALTSFEILEYCPKVPFSSANLCFTDTRYWNWIEDKISVVFLGMHKYLPENCVVKGSFLLLSVLNLKIGLYCIMCLNLVARKLCPNCDREFESVSWELQIKMTLFGQDSISSRFKITTECIGFLYRLLRLPRARIKSFCEVFSKTRQLYIDFGDTSRDFSYEGEEVKEFLDDFCDYVRSEINYKQHPAIDAICVKQDSGCDWKMIDFNFV